MYNPDEMDTTDKSDLEGRTGRAGKAAPCHHAEPRVHGLLQPWQLLLLAKRDGEA